MINSIKSFIKNEYMLIISFICAAATALIIPPSIKYLEYIDYRVLCLLFCLMTVVNGLKNEGTFNTLTYQLLKKINNGHILSLTLVMLPFFTSMLITNDVALLVFIPFTIALMNRLSAEKSIVPVIVLQTVAANLGSMATPVGNPQNLFIYSAYDLSATEFFSVTLPLTLVSLVFLSVLSYPVIPKKLHIAQLNKEEINSKTKLLLYILLFTLCLLTVFKIIPYTITTAIIIICFLFSDRKALKNTDYSLLATFVCFFIISENLSQIEAIKNFAETLLSKNTILTAVASSQIISNVPAATLLSGFTDNWTELLKGVNIGGLGTPVASLASLITIKLYTKNEKAQFLKFMAIFTAVNIAGLIILLAFEAAVY